CRGPGPAYLMSSPSGWLSSWADPVLSRSIIPVRCRDLRDQLRRFAALLVDSGQMPRPNSASAPTARPPRTTRSARRHHDDGARGAAPGGSGPRGAARSRHAPDTYRRRPDSPSLPPRGNIRGADAGEHRQDHLQERMDAVGAAAVGLHREAEARADYRVRVPRQAPARLRGRPSDPAGAWRKPQICEESVAGI